MSATVVYNKILYILVGLISVILMTFLQNVLNIVIYLVTLMCSINSAYSLGEYSECLQCQP